MIYFATPIKNFLLIKKPNRSIYLKIPLFVPQELINTDNNKDNSNKNRVIGKASYPGQQHALVTCPQKLVNCYTAILHVSSADHHHQIAQQEYADSWGHVHKHFLLEGIQSPVPDEETANNKDECALKSHEDRVSQCVILGMLSIVMVVCPFKPGHFYQL